MDDYFYNCQREMSGIKFDVMNAMHTFILSITMDMRVIGCNECRKALPNCSRVDVPQLSFSSVMITSFCKESWLVNKIKMGKTELLYTLR